MNICTYLFTLRLEIVWYTVLIVFLTFLFKLWYISMIFCLDTLVHLTKRKQFIIYEASHNISHFIDNHFIIFPSVNSQCNSAGNYLFHVVIHHPLSFFYLSFSYFYLLPFFVLSFFLISLICSSYRHSSYTFVFPFISFVPLSPFIHTTPLQKTYKKIRATYYVIWTFPARSAPI
jgi:hypothetical protein